MRDGWPSLTALAVAVGRGIAPAPEEVDPSAAALVPPPIGRVLAWIGRSSSPDVVRSALRVASLGMVDHVSLRRSAIDAALHEAIDAGATQLVVLGAGLDGRAWRMEALGEVTVFEVDHPATQAGKRRRVADRPTRAAAVRFVAVDFERDTLADRLAEAGHDPQRPSAWIWEGVTPYLVPPAIEATLADVSARSAPGSRLLMSYAVTRASWRLPGLDGLIAGGFATLGEPLRGLMEPDAAARLLDHHGFVVLEDTNNREWATQHRGNAAMARLFSAERLAVASRAYTH